MRTRLFAILLVAGITSMARAELKTESFDYKQGDTALEGYLAYDAALPGKHPGVLVVHDWMGQGPFSKSKADALAKLGYVAIAVDIYGKDVRPSNQREASEQAGKFKNDRKLLRARMQAALDVLKARDNVDPSRIAAIGHCFGGTS